MSNIHAAHIVTSTLPGTGALTIALDLGLTDLHRFMRAGDVGASLLLAARLTLSSRRGNAVPHALCPCNERPYDPTTESACGLCRALASEP